MSENDGIKLVGGDPPEKPVPSHDERILCPHCGCDRRVTGHGYSFEGVNIPGVGKMTQLVVFCSNPDCRVQLAFVVLGFEPVIAQPQPGSRFRI